MSRVWDHNLVRSSTTRIGLRGRESTFRRPSLVTGDDPSGGTTHGSVRFATDVLPMCHAGDAWGGRRCGSDPFTLSSGGDCVAEYHAVACGLNAMREERPCPRSSTSFGTRRRTPGISSSLVWVTSDSSTAPLASGGCGARAGTWKLKGRCSPCRSRSSPVAVGERRGDEGRPRHPVEAWGPPVGLRVRPGSQASQAMRRSSITTDAA